LRRRPGRHRSALASSLQQAIADCQARLAQIEVRDLGRSDARDQEPAAEHA
jgi:hypothetical protein